MRGPYSDYAAPPIYISPEPSGPRPGVRFSRQELFQLGVAILALSAALTLANFSALRAFYLSSQLPLLIGLWFSGALVAVGSGVGLHEISHKIVAQRYGHWAEFRYNLRGLGLSFLQLVAAELIASSSGLGWLIWDARFHFMGDRILVGMIGIGVLGYGLNRLALALERRMVRWQPLGEAVGIGA